MSSRHAGQHGHDRHDRRGRREAFRAWRRSRPFWGGLLLLIAGLELLAIPLSGVLMKGQVKLVIYIGIGGVFGAGIGALLVAAGIVMWVNPTHRVFYGLAGIVLGILSFPASNLGGFFLGMLLAVIGGALAFAWVPGESGRRRFPPAAGPSFTPGDAPGADVTRVDMPAVDMPAVDPSMSRQPGSAGSRSAPGSRMLAVAAMPAVLVAGMAGTGGAVHAAALPRAAGSCILGIFCSSPTPSPSPGASSPAAANSPDTGTAGTGTAGSTPGGLLPSPLPSGSVPGVSVSPSPSATGGGKTKNASVKQVKSPSGVVAPSATSVLTARSATMKQFNFAGVADVPVGGGGSERALEFTAGSAAMSAVGIKVTQDGSSVVTKTASLDFNGGLTLYTTKLCGQVEGVTPVICFTPGTASQIALKLASVLGKAAPITMTSVTTDQFTVSAGSMRWGALSMGA